MYLTLPEPGSRSTRTQGTSHEPHALYRHQPLDHCFVPGRARNVGDRYASLSSDACQAPCGEPAGSYTYGLDAKLERAEAPKAKRSLGDKFDDAYIGAWTTVFVIALLPLVLIGLAVDKATD